MKSPLLHSAFLIALFAPTGASAFVYAAYDSTNFGSSAPIQYLTGSSFPAGSQATRTGTGSFAGFGNFGITASVVDGDLAGDQGAPGGGHWGSTVSPIPTISVIARPTSILIDQSLVSLPLRPLVPISGLQVLGFKGDADTNVSFTLDFTTLSTGVLPAGSVFALNDIDGDESMFLRAMMSSSAETDWWEYVIGGDSSETSVTSGQPDATLLDLPTPGNTGTPGELGVIGKTSLTDAPLVFFRTLKDIDTLEIDAKDADASSYYQSFTIAIVPEPGTTALSVLTVALLALRRRRLS
jgi:hypothetical protein